MSKIFSVPIKTIDKDIAEMRNLKNFNSFILRPSYKRVLISITGYEMFLQSKSSKLL
ncbi:DNA-binding protein [Lactococcus lactis]|nr:DNA-binding protein [Lactococcus lactis]